MGTEGTTPVIISCPLGSGTAGEVEASKDSTKASEAEGEASEAEGEASGFSSGFFGKVGRRRRFFGTSQKDPDLGPSPSRTSKINTNMTFSP